MLNYDALKCTTDLLSRPGIYLHLNKNFSQPAVNVQIKVNIPNCAILKLNI